MMFIHLVMVVVQLVMVLIQVAQASGSGAETHATRKKLEIDGGPPQGSQLVSANLLSGASSGSPSLAIPRPGTVDPELNQPIASGPPSQYPLEVVNKASCKAKSLNVYFSSTGNEQTRWKANHQPKTEPSDRFRCRQPLSPAPEQTFCIAKSLNVYLSSTGIKQLVAERSQAQRHLYRPAGGNASYLLAERLYVLRTPPVLGGGPDLWSALRDQVGSSH
jgi:hypothetical protein